MEGEVLKVGDPVEMSLSDVYAAAGRVLGVSHNREVVFVELRLSRRQGQVRRLPDLTTPEVSTQRCRCSFCHKSNDEVFLMVAGGGCYICDECVDVCVEIINERISKEPQATATENEPSPATA